jgi:hypothetical protein
VKLAWPEKPNESAISTNGRSPRVKKRFRALKTPGADVAMRRLPDGQPEGPREMVSAQARNRCHAIDAEIAFTAT